MSTPRQPRSDAPDPVESLVEEIVLRRLRGENVQVDAILRTRRGIAGGGHLHVVI